MATVTAYDASLIDRIKPRISQYEATTGRPISPQILESLLKAELEVEASKSRQDRGLALQEEQFNKTYELQKEQLKNADEAAKAGFVGNLTETALLGGLAYKALKPPAPSTTPAIATAGAAPATAALPPVTSTTPWSTGGISGIDYGAQTQIGLAPAVGDIPAASTPALAPPATAEAATATAGSVIGSVASGAGAVLAAQKFGVPLLTRLGVPEPQAKGFAASGAVGVARSGISEAVSKITGNNTVGDVVGWVVDPIGSAVEAVTDLSVICTELNRQGAVTDSELRWARKFRRDHVSDSTFEGYLRWATPVVNRMRKQGRFNQMVRPLALLLVRQWVNIAKGRRGTAAQRIVYAVAYAASRLAYRYGRRRLVGVACG